MNSDKAAAKRPDGRPVGRPFKKGKSGNPAGRKPGSVSIKAELQKILNLVLKGEINPVTLELEEDMPVGRKIALNMVKLALNETTSWSNNGFRIMEQLDGKPAQALNLGGQDGENPVQVSSKLTVELVRPKGRSNE